jgi:hypothetical protein
MLGFQPQIDVRREVHTEVLGHGIRLQGEGVNLVCIDCEFFLGSLKGLVVNK